MAELLAGQIIRAVDLNYPIHENATLSGGPTSGTTELLLTGSLTIPAQPIDVLVIPTLLLSITATVDNDRFQVRIRDTNVSGTLRATTTTKVGTTDSIVIPSAPAISLTAGVTLTLVATLARIAGTGTASVSTSTGSAYLAATVIADR